jgi:hypothetical protein
MLAPLKIFYAIYIIILFLSQINTAKRTHRHGEIRNKTKASTLNVRVMSFNIWNCGTNVDDGPRKIVNAIENSQADIVGLQV